MNKDELRKRADNLESELKKLREEIDKPEPTKSKTSWIPIEGESFYYIASRQAYLTSYKNGDDPWPLGHLEQGNYFQTKELAQRELERLKLLEKIKRWKIENDPDSFKLGWRNFKQQKYQLGYDCVAQRWRGDLYWLWTTTPGAIYFSSENAANACIKYFGGRLHLLLEESK